MSLRWHKCWGKSWTYTDWDSELKTKPCYCNGNLPPAIKIHAWISRTQASWSHAHDKLSVTWYIWGVHMPSSFCCLPKAGVLSSQRLMYIHVGIETNMHDSRNHEYTIHVSFSLDWGLENHSTCRCVMESSFQHLWNVVVKHLTQTIRNKPPFNMSKYK